MKKNFTVVVFFVAFTLGAGTLVGAQNAERKIVIFEKETSIFERDTLIQSFGGEKIKDLSSVNGAVVVLPRGASMKLFKEYGVVRVDDDAIVTTMEKPAGTTVAAQVMPWGIDRIDAELVWPEGNSAGMIKVGIIDTGISTRHPDLIANVRGGINTINLMKSWNDDNGHGSHVAGIVGAVNNTVGVVGTAPAVNLYAVKVLGANGSGYVSDIIEGLDWSIQNGMQVVNMSLGTTADIQSFHDAIIAAKNAGIMLVVAAGNSGGAVNYPAAYPETIAVSATDVNDSIASFSSRGAEVDLTAPGVSIYSTYKGTGYATLSGTSMASPHIAGVAAMVLNTSVGISDTNGNGVWDVDEVTKRLKDSATDLGTAGFDNLYGWGLVNAYRATR